MSLTRLQPSRALAAVTRLVPDSYLTDGKRLLRVVSLIDPRADCASASLEDCLTLEVRAYSPDELVAMGLRRVRGPA